MTIRLPLIPQKNYRAWPKSEQGGRVLYFPVADLMTVQYPSDAHFACYSVAAHERRLSVELVRDPANADKIPDGVPMVAAVFDVDCEQSHKSSGSKTLLPAPDEWWIAELPKITALREAHPGGFVYRTKGGYRIVFELAKPFGIKDAADDEQWTSVYVRWVAYLRRVFGIFADPSCSEWTRLFRAPHATRDGNAKPENRETIGDPNIIGTWVCEPSPDDIALALTLKKQSKPKKSKAPKRSVATACVGEGVLFHAFSARGELGQQIEPGKWAVKCPWGDRHSKGTDLDTSTILYAPDTSDGETLGWVHCSHQHCQTLNAADVIAHFPADELAAARVASGLPEDGQAPKPAIDLLYDRSGNPKKIVANVLAVLSGASECTDLLAYDEFREAIVVRRDPPCRESERPPKRETDEWTEEDSTRFAAWCASTFDLDVSAGQVEESVRTVARKHTVHPVRDWQDSLTWDGTARIATLFVTYFGAADTAYHAGIATCWMVSAVARVHQPGCQADYLIVLESRVQGIGKTTGLEALAGKEWFSDTALDIDSKDGMQCLRGKWIHLFDELEGISGRAAVSRVKNFLSRRDDNYRPSYGRRNRTFQRQNVFAATTNEEEYLQDQTGNRRIWPVQCGHLVDVEGIRRDRDQLWAEAVHLYKSGTKWWPTQDLVDKCRPEQDRRTRQDAWLDQVEEWLSWPHEVSVDRDGRIARAPLDVSEGITTANVLMHALGKKIGDCRPGDEQRIGVILRQLGYERKQRRIEGKRVWHYTKSVTSAKPGDGPGDGPGDTTKEPNTSVRVVRHQVSPGITHNGHTHESGSCNASQRIVECSKVGVTPGDSVTPDEDVEREAIGMEGSWLS